MKIRNLKFLQTALSRASLGRPGGSQTASRTEITKELESGVVNAIRNFIDKPFSGISQAGVSTITGSTQKAAAARNTATLAKALYDPTWKAEMSAIRGLNPNSPAAGRAMAQLLKEINTTEGEQ